MNSSVGQLSAAASMLQFSLNEQGTICEINRLPSLILKEKLWASTTVLNFRHKEHSLSSCFGKQVRRVW